jgi:putative methanogen marker protein 4
LIDVNALLSRGARSRVKVGIGGSSAVLADTKRLISSPGGRIPLVGFEEPRDLVVSLKRGEIGVAVRGTLSSSKVLQCLKDEFRLKEVMRAAVLEDSRGKPFILAPVGIDEGIDYPSRIRLASATIEYFSRLGWDLKTGILSKGRLEDGSRGPQIRRSLEEGEMLAKALREQGTNARHYAILVEDAVKECDLVIAPDGVSGNLIFRSLHFVGATRAYGAPVVNLDKVFVDTSRGKADFSDSVLFAAGLAESRSKPMKQA